MNFNKHVKDKILSLISCGAISINELVSFLQKNPNITSLNLSGKNIGDQSIIALSRLKNLTSLTLSSSHISGGRAKELAVFSDSISLALVKNNISNEGAQELAKLENINILIDNTVSAEGAKESAKLTSVDFNKYVRGNILSVQLCSTINISKLVSFLQNKPNITSLNLADCNIGNKGIKELAKLKSLTSLTLVGNNINDEGAKSLANLTNLTSFDLSDNNISNEGAKKLAKLTNLTSLDLSDNNISNEGAKELAKLENLTYLALEGNNVSPQVAQELSTKLKKLTSFDLKESALGNITNQSTTTDNYENAKTLPNIEHKPIVDKPNSNHISKPVLGQGNSTQSFSNLRKEDNTTHSTQLPVITTSIPAVVGIVSGIAIAVYLKMLAVGIVVGCCCLVTSAILYYCNKPSNSLENSNVKKLCENTQVSASLSKE